MNFFTTSDNQAIQASTSFDAGAGFEPMPKNTQLKVIIEEAAWTSSQHEEKEFISLTWLCIDGEFKKRKVFQKLHVLHPDTKKSDKAKTMLAAIDANAGGALMASGTMPDDMALSINLMNKPMAIVLDVWEIDGKSGNWVKAVAPLNAQAKQPAAQQQSVATSQLTPPDNNFDPEIGF